MAEDKDEEVKRPTLRMEHVKDFLQRNSSANHKLSLNEIAMGLSVEFDNKGNNCLTEKNIRVYDPNLIDNSIRVQLGRLLKAYGTGSYPFLKNSADIHIFCTEKNCDFTGNNENKVLPDPDKKVFYAQSVLNEESIAILRDSLTVFSYAEPAVTMDIISRLNRMASKYNQAEYDPKRVSAVKYPGTYYENVSEIMKALAAISYDNEDDIYLDNNKKKMIRSEYEKKRQKKIKKISFEYYAYNAKKQLELRLTKKGESVRIVNPVKLLWANGYYYLVAAYPYEDEFDGKKKFNFVNYRVDRMKEVRCLDEDAEIPNEFVSDKYRNSHPIMHAGESESLIEIRCRKNLINNALDTFGFDIEITPEDDGENVLIRLKNTTAEGVKMWALEYGSGCEILSPNSLRKAMRNAAMHLLDIYN